MNLIDSYIVWCSIQDHIGNQLICLVNSSMLDSKGSLLKCEIWDSMGSFIKISVTNTMWHPENNFLSSYDFI